MFVFENLLDIDDRGIQLLLREIQSDSLIPRFEGRFAGTARQDIQEHVATRRRNAREDLESKGPVRLSEVEAEQKENPQDRPPPRRRRPDRPGGGRWDQMV